MDSSNFSSGNSASHPFFSQVGSLPINLKPFILHLKQETNTLTSYPPLQLKSHTPSPFQNKLISNHFDIYLKLPQYKSTIPGCSVGKESACNAGDTGDEGSIPGSGRSLGRGHGNPLQYSCQRMPRTEQPGGLQSQAHKSPLILLTAVFPILFHGNSTLSIAQACWIIEKTREFQKNIYFCFIDYAKAFNCVDHNKQWKILKEMRMPDRLSCLLRNLYAGQGATVRTGQGTTDWFQIGKGVYQGCILSPCLFNLYAEYIIVTLGWKKHKLELRLLGEGSITSDMQMTPPLGQKVKRNKKPLDESERE